MDAPFPFGLPLPTAFYLVVYVVTLVLHVVFMNYVLAGTAALALAYFRPGHRGMGESSAILKEWLPFMLSGAITAGVAPLLFLQILYKREYYTANLLLFNRWMAILPALIVGFYALYLLKSHWLARRAGWIAAGVSLIPLATVVFTGYSWTENRAQTGDFAAFEELVARLQGRVYGVAYRILGQAQDAEDVVQQTFLSLIEHIDSYRGESAVATWVLRIATNFALKILRKKRGKPNIFFEGGDESFDTVPHPEYIAQWRDTPDRLVERAELRDLLDRAIAELDDKYRVVFVLRDIEDLSTEETADALGLSISNVKVRLLRARLQLRERLTRELGDEATRVQPDHTH